MKSLEIVNANIKVLEEQLNELEDELDKTCVEIELKQLQQIKQDLEVLEIIRKKDVLTGVLKCCLKNPANDKEALDIYNLPFPDYRELTMEELLKIKKWLEANE